MGKGGSVLYFFNGNFSETTTIIFNNVFDLPIEITFTNTNFVFLGCKNITTG